MNSVSSTAAVQSPLFQASADFSSRRRGIFLFDRLGRAIGVIVHTLLTLLWTGLGLFFIGLIASSVLAEFGFALAAILLVIVWGYYAARCVLELLFTCVCSIEESDQVVAERSRLHMETVREETRDGQFAYSKSSTTFRTVQSGHFIFKMDGYHELRPGDVVRLRLYRWTSSSGIRDYKICRFRG